MINKINKRIHNKILNFIKFFFFLRYLIVIFLIATPLFLSIPKFFNYEKKKEIIRDYLIKNYDLELNKYNTIEFKIFPFPNLIIKDVNTKVKNKAINIQSKNINIFLTFKNIYNYENFKAKRIILNKNKISLDVNKTKEIINFIKILKYKLDIKNLNLNLTKDDKSLINITNINFSNYGRQKYHFDGKIFKKDFKATLENNNKDLSFKILDTGIKAKIKLNEKNKKNFNKGSSKISLSNNLLSFDFNLNNNQMKIINSNFRNKDLSFSFDSLIKFSPFFHINSNIHINEINKDLITGLNLEKKIKDKEVIKKLNGKININFKNRGYFTNLIEEYTSTINLAYGRLLFSNKILILGGEINCKGDSVLIDEYPRLNFICLFNFDDNKKLLNKLNISKTFNKGSLNFNVEGSFNLLNKKVNFKKINIENSNLANSNLANSEDLIYYKNVFERILFDGSFFNIFNKNKIKKFILEII